VSDLASHFFVKAGITAIRRVRKTDNLRIGRCSGATIVSRTEELSATDVGTGVGLFEIRKYGEEYFMFLEECKDPKACSILLRGGSKDVLMEFERNLQVRGVPTVQSSLMCPCYPQCPAHISFSSTGCNARGA
jgi:T-complex protein 1 subunit gamma